MSGQVRLFVLALLAGLVAAAGPASASSSAFANWAVVVVAGDWHAHSGGPTEAFDNARRDVAASLGRMGFAPGNIHQFSVRPELYPDTKPVKTELNSIFETLQQSATTATGGCLFYITSHGAPGGALLDQGLLPPAMLNAVVDRACPDRPSVVVISACFSGVYVPILAESNRMILTAARPDRTSFGCSESDKYPYFDDCFLKSAPSAHDFTALGSAVRRCVAEKESATGASPPSEPQMWVGPMLAPMLPLYAFARP